MKCRIFKSLRHAGMYLYLPETAALDDLDATLRAHFGAAEEVMTLELGPETRLARAAASEVIESLEEKGYYLQMPPGNPLTGG